MHRLRPPGSRSKDHDCPRCCFVYVAAVDLPGVPQNELSLDEQSHQLHERYYQSCPADYFEQRVAQMVLFASEQEAVEALFRRGVEFDGYELGSDGQPLGDQDRDRVWRNTTIDAVVLLHTAAESLIRLFFAHISNHWSPWVAVAEQRGGFKSDVREWLEQADLDQVEEAVHWVFFGEAVEAVGLGVTALTAILREAARSWLDQGDVYNAAKHGFAALAGGTAVELHLEGLDVIEWAKGPSVEIITAGKKAGLRREVHWINPGHNVKRVELMCFAIHNLWTIAKLQRNLIQQPVDLWIPPVTYKDLLERWPDNRATFSGPVLLPPIDRSEPPTEST